MAHTEPREIAGVRGRVVEREARMQLQSQRRAWRHGPGPRTACAHHGRDAVAHVGVEQRVDRARQALPPVRVPGGPRQVRLRIQCKQVLERQDRERRRAARDVREYLGDRRRISRRGRVPAGAQPASCNARHSAARSVARAACAATTSGSTAGGGVAGPASGGGVVLAEVAARGTVSSCSCSVNASGRIRASASSDCCAASAAIRRQARSTPRHQPATVGRSCVDGIAIASRSHADGGRKAPPASRSNHSTRIPAMPCAPSRSRKPAGTVPRSSPIASAR